MTTMTADEAVRAAILKVAPEAEFTDLDPGESLRAALDLDSLDFLAVLENVALLTGVSVPESAYAAVDSLDGLIAHVALRIR
jgi:acyl carrier protein